LRKADSALRILVFRIGQLGDTLVAVPALHALRAHFPCAHVTLLCDRHPGRGYRIADEVLAGSGLVDGFESYPVGARGPGKIRMALLLARLRRRRFDLLAYLAPSTRPPERVRRDLAYFRWAGIERTVGGEGFDLRPPTQPGAGLPELPREADLLLARLARSGVAVPAPGKGNCRIALGDAEREEVEDWLPEYPQDLGRPWIGVGPGSKMPSKVWPVERYAEVVERLIRRFDVWPVVFGGPEDRATGARLLLRWKRGYNAAGHLGVRAAAAALARCRLYVGNDTGTMHLAVAAGTRCVALFSSRDHPGLWEPYGEGHVVLRTRIDCEGCMLERCEARALACLLAIGTHEVERECALVLEGARAQCKEVSR